MDVLLKGSIGSFKLGSTIVRVGRSPDNQLIVNDSDVSWVHAEIFPQGNGYVIVDLGSTNGTFLNGERLQPKTPCRLNVGDAIRFGATMFSYIVDAPASQAIKLADSATMPQVRGYQQPPDFKHSNVPPRKKNRKKVSWIAIVGGLASLATIFGVIWTVYTFYHPTTSPPSPRPGPTTSIPQLHASYNGNLTNTANGSQFPLTISSLTEDGVGNFNATGNDGLCPVTYQGAIRSDSSITFTATEAIGTNTNTGTQCGSVGTFSGKLFADSHLAGTWEGSTNGTRGTWSVS